MAHHHMTPFCVIQTAPQQSIRAIREISGQNQVSANNRQSQ